ncbi:DNA methyltransferase [Acinetobacter seifertii]|uniref:DNA methyltransferase n=1 Tax=Acinetobacter seifertii TaxID=1530123 RepID=UPI00124C5560|nr:DNA methyltransferase [Acinetobacter seifertii]
MTLAYRKENTLNAICPYFTMFPLEYPIKVLKRYKKESPIVLDPFCGRGTTLFAARKLGLSAWGIDTSPIAVAIAKAKLATCNIEEPLELAKKLILEVDPISIPKTPFFQMAFHRETLRDICALREGLLNIDEDTDASIILRAAILGCLHGPLSKNLENASYFSNQMPRTYASKPDYAVRYWSARNLQAPKFDVLKVLRRKIERLTGLEIASPNHFNQVLHGDAQTLQVYEKISSSPSIVITSPPYYGMKTYVQDQWLRNWLLGGPDEVDYSAGLQLNHAGEDAFSKSLGSVWRNISEITSQSQPLHLYVRFGIIPSASVNAKEIFKNSLEHSGENWKLVSVRAADTANAGKRQAAQMKTASTAAVEFDFHVIRK